MFKEQNKMASKEIKESIRMISLRTKNNNKDRSYKYEQKKILELKSVTTQI